MARSQNRTPRTKAAQNALEVAQDALDVAQAIVQPAAPSDAPAQPTTEEIDAAARAIVDRILAVPMPKPIEIDMSALDLDDLPFIHRLRRFYNDDLGDEASPTDLEIIAVLDRAVVGGKKAVPLTRYREAIYTLLISVFGASNPETAEGN